MRKAPFAEGEYYHVYNRGVEKRLVFLGRRDYERFTYLLYACNDTKPLLNTPFYYRGLTSIAKTMRRGNRLVDILCFCLMPNHFHLLLQQRTHNGISLFMQKVGTGYAMYFNKKYQRVGALFQGSFKAVHIDREEYLTHLTRYIHLNPAEFREPQWKEKGIHNARNTHEFVKHYPWSSYADYLGRGHFAPILNKELISALYETPSEYESFVQEWLANDLEPITPYTIEVKPQ